MTRLQWAFLVLVMVQAVHSSEEYRGRLYDVFLPARIVSGLISPNLERGFIIGNVTLVAFGLWCVDGWWRPDCAGCGSPSSW